MNLSSLFTSSPSATKPISKNGIFGQNSFYKKFPTAPDNISTLDASIISELSYLEDNKPINDSRDVNSSETIINNFLKNKTSFLEENGSDFDKTYPNTYANALISNSSENINTDGLDDSKVKVEFHSPVTGGSKKSRTRKTKKSRKNKQRRTRKN